MLKRILFLLCVACLLCGCSKRFDGEEITFSSWGSVSEVSVIKDVIKDFETKNPTIKVNFIHIPQNYFQKLHLLFASNTAPDVVFINNLYLPLYASKLEDLTPKINRNDFYPQAVEGLSYKGQVLAIPRDISNLVLYVNLDLLNENGLKLPAENWTLDEFLTYAQKLSKKGIYGISYETEVYWLSPYLSYFGGGILSEDGQYIIESEESKEAINFYKDLILKYKIAPTKSQVGSSTLAQMFLNGKVAMYLSGRWMYPKISEKADFNWAVINFPYGKSAQLSDSSGWAISKNSKHKDSACKFVEFLSSKENVETFVQTGLIVPARIDSSDKIEQAFLSVIKHSAKTPVSKDYKKMTDEINLKLNL